ncbi:hypothetical protein HBI56_069040 [Parastagonospora nodorum]|uniref:Uncharacterized protein n=2 Tax=Phaeosphaeria nodorum (strain SN15 / ATCC MYA-4574 / FGSC 10173) TaxID=321614 RepID=A0A7U2HSI6_PHANO|nr:hypothetical protein SNOG_09679 [Parastagonospora nodorum SN15]KAH3920357.1 hypothetical protein HBH56_003480 [Parastagonospora nodorum]EAT82944.1 hypothetical protein SNOG_09679 [Parastagonospora nodorum SN15]KAH3938041.1 hypothetical protein HBH54_003470 [Parastagonospora nodorum]KAH3946492.1 hypothetical protein HBH53_128520 [Parastagonospora nodorum]KAH3975191.1 hypothetical protein HBH51_086240 [Parastagonospora nodorum]
MKFTISLATLLCSSVLAAPTPSEVTDKVSQCIHLAGYSFDRVSSVRPNEGSFCYFYVSEHRNSDEDLEFFHVGYPGVADLSKKPVNGPAGSTHDFDNKLQSLLYVDD